MPELGGIGCGVATTDGGLLGDVYRHAFLH